MISKSGFFQRRLVLPLVELLRQGVSPDKLALAVALGITLGIFPMIGSTTILCALVGHLFRVNPVAIQIVNYFTYPLQLAFFIPFFAAGAWLFGTESIPFSVEEIFVRLSEQPWQTIQSLWMANIRAVVAWCLIAGPLIMIIRLLLRPLFSRLVPRDAA